MTISVMTFYYMLNTANSREWEKNCLIPSH